MEITTLGIDLAKSVFQFHGVGTDGAVVLQKKLRRGAVLEFLGKLEPCLIGIEACPTSHFWAREIAALGHEVRPTTLVDISSVMATMEAMLCCHESQRDWLRAHHGVDEYVDSMKAFAVLRGSLMGWEAGEGFRQHLGHCYPQDNRLAKVLPGFVFENEGIS